MTAPLEKIAPDIRLEAARDAAAIDALYPSAFPEEDLVPLVTALRSDPSAPLSLVAVYEKAVVGHAAFSACRVQGAAARLALLGPLAVSPSLHRRGVGSSLVRAGFERLRASGVDRVLVLGDPSYYQRFGFEIEPDVAPPHPIPDDWRSAWRSVSLTGALSTAKGRLIAPPPWDEPALWGQ